MKPDNLIDRKQTMTILDIRNPAKFKELWCQGLLPAPLGTCGTSYMWSATLIRQMKEKLDEGHSLSRKMVEDLVLDATVRLTSKGSIKI